MPDTIQCHFLSALRVLCGYIFSFYFGRVLAQTQTVCIGRVYADSINCIRTEFRPSRLAANRASSAAEITSDKVREIAVNETPKLAVIWIEVVPVVIVIAANLLRNNLATSTAS
jgi:hypothetical protein